MKKRNKKRQYRYINGAKGAISLFMAVLMTPFLSIAFLLVETGRYNSMISLMEETMGVSSLATLANYDDYLQERWGLLAVSQGIDIDKTFGTYMEGNQSVMGSKVVLNEIKAEGTYPLINSPILKNQIMEYSKLNIPTKLAFEIGDFSKLISNFEKKINGLSQIENLASSGIEIANAGVSFAQGMEKLEDISKELEKNRDKEYSGKYSDFATSVNTLIDNMNRERTLEAEIPALETQLSNLNAELTQMQSAYSNTSGKSEEQIAAEQEALEAKKQEIAGVQSSLDDKRRELKTVKKNITNGYSSSETAQDKYAEWLDVVIENLEDFKEAMEESEQAISDAVSNFADGVKNAAELSTTIEKKRVQISEAEAELKKTQKQMQEMRDKANHDPDSKAYRDLQTKESNQQYNLQQLQDELINEEMTAGLTSAGSDAIGAMDETYKKTSEGYDKETIEKAIKDMEEQKAAVTKLDIRSLTYQSPKVTADVYKFAKIEGFLSVKTLGDMANHLADKFADSTLQAVLDMIESVYDSIMGLSVIVENDLSAVIDTGYYDSKLGGLPGADATVDGVLAIFEELGNLLKSPFAIGNAWKEFINKPSWKRFKAACKSLLTPLEAVAKMYIEIGSVFVDILTNLATLFFGYERLYLSTYCGYNLSCRTDYNESLEHTSFTNITGYSAGYDSFPQSSRVNLPAFGEIWVMIQSLYQSMSKSGKDLTFYGAELEYALFGSKSEVANQMYVFVVLYLIRLLVSFTSVQANAEIQALAAASTIGYPVVITLFTFLEPLAQTIMLVNGKAQSIMPTTVYLAPSGLPTLLSDLITFCKLDSTKQDQLKSKMMEVCKADSGKYQSQLDSITSAQGYTPPKGKSSYFDFSYRDHCYVWLLLSVRDEAMLARLKDIIQMETLYYYKQKEAKYIFDLRNTFTYLDTSVNLDIKQLMPSLLDSGLFEVTVNQYRGY